MKKLKIYLDTTVVCHLDQQDAPERMAETHKLWEKVKAGRFDVVLSNVTLNEIDDCTEEKKTILYGYLNQIDFTTVIADERAMEIASKLIGLGVLRKKRFR